MTSLYPAFSHIYLEHEAAELPLTQEILRCFPRSVVIPIENYRDIFNQPRQDWREQKLSQKLIIAAKHGRRVHPATAVLPAHAGDPLYYTSTVINCVFDCQYCFLQAMYRSAHMIAFVNEADFYLEVRELVAEKGPITLSVSYDADILGSEKFIPWTARWIQFARENPEVTVEIRTKSQNYSLISALPSHPRVILAWSMAPESIWRRYEFKTASPTQRIDAAARAASDGWRVRLCFDPVLPVENWRGDYQKLVAQIVNDIGVKAVEDISVGVFRVGDDHFRNFKERNPTLDLLQAPMEERGAIKQLKYDGSDDIQKVVRDMLLIDFPEEKVVLW